MSQNGFFDEPLKPWQGGERKGIVYRHTSREAWASLLPVAAELDRVICAYIEKNGSSTDWQIERGTGRSHQSVSGNRRHLVERKVLMASGGFGKTGSGRRAIKWTFFGQADDPAPKEA